MIKSGKEYLAWTTERIEYLDECIASERERLATIKMDLQALGSPLVSERVQTSPVGDSVAVKVARAEELEVHIVQLKDQKAKTKKRALDYLDMIQDEQLKNCLKQRHIELKSNATIAGGEKITERGLRKRFSRAYRCFEGIYSLENIRKIKKSIDSSS